MKLLFKLIEFSSWGWLALALYFSWFSPVRLVEVFYCLVVFIAHRVYLIDLRLENAGKRG